MFAISYDDATALRTFAEAQNINFPLLSDQRSEVIKQFGVLNTEVAPGDVLFYGIPFPGVFVTDSDGVLISKFFHDSYKKRESPETIIEAVTGNIVLNEVDVGAHVSADDIHMTAKLHGGRGTIRQGVIRKLVVGIDLPKGLHVYDAPVPDGMQPLEITIEGPPGLVVGPIQKPPTKPLTIAEPAITLQVWSGAVTFWAEAYAVGELASEVRPLDTASVQIRLDIALQACDATRCLLPTRRSLTLDVPLEVVDVPAMPIHMGHGQREGNFDAMPHMRRLVWRKFRENPLAVPAFIWKNRRMERAARARQQSIED